MRRRKKRIIFSIIKDFAATRPQMITFESLCYVYKPTAASCTITNTLFLDYNQNIIYFKWMYTKENQLARSHPLLSTQN
jgi:hypothetical protein